jgi:hypothetical protein
MGNISPPRHCAAGRLDEDYMSEPFRFSAAARPQAEVRVDIPVETPGPILFDADRIAAARAIGIAHSRERNAPGAEYGWGYPPSHYQDFGFGSAWFAHHVWFLATYILEATCEGTRLPLGESHRFDPRTGLFDGIRLASGVTFSISDLITVYKLRIKELGLSEPLLEEWSAQIHSREDDRKFYALDFAGRMETFKSAKA